MNAKEHFQRENPDSGKLRELRERYGLEGVVAGIAGEFDRMIALRRWVQRTLNPHGYDHIQENKCALAILAAAREGKRFNCWYYATVMKQAAAALGFTARRLAVGIHPAMIRPGNTGHTAVELWSNEFGKWVLMDADFNGHHLVKGIPANGLDLHRQWLAHRLQEVEYVQGEPLPAMLAAYKTPQDRSMQSVCMAYNLVDYFFQLNVQLCGDECAGAANGDIRAIAWMDAAHPEYPAKAGRTIDRVLYTDDPAILYWRED